MRVCFETFGCQMNKLDSELMLGLLEEAGYESCDDPESADLILFNTCSVRKHAEDRVYARLGMLKRIKQRRPDVVIGVLGCMAQKERERLFDAAPHLDLVCGTREFARLPALVEAVREGRARQLAVDETGELKPLFSLRRPRPDARQAFVSVMRGCDNFCAYCVVPFVRGREISRSPAQIVDEVKTLVDAGVVEVTLLGQNISSYGKKLAEGRGPKAEGAAEVTEDLASLLHRVSAVEGLKRLRFITSHPAHMTDAVLEAMRDLPNVMEYLHMPAQSGSSSVLARMNRGYTREEYLALVEKTYETVPGIAIAGDFIVGYPGETEEEFRDSVTLVERCRFSGSFVFKYSPRPGTKAADLADDVPTEVKRRRNQELLAAQERVSIEENARFVGRDVEVLVEGPSRTDASRMMGRARDHRIVIIRDDENEPGDRATGGLPTRAEPGKIVDVRITNSTALALYGCCTGGQATRGTGGDRHGART